MFFSRFSSQELSCLKELLYMDFLTHCVKFVIVDGLGDHDHEGQFDTDIDILFTFSRRPTVNIFFILSILNL